MSTARPWTQWYALSQGPLLLDLRRNTRAITDLRTYLRHLKTQDCAIEYRLTDFDADSDAEKPIYLKIMLRLNCRPSSSAFRKTAERQKPDLSYALLNDAVQDSDDMRTAAALEGEIVVDDEEAEVYLTTIGKDKAAIPSIGKYSERWRTGKTLLCVFVLAAAVLFEQHKVNLDKVPIKLVVDAKASGVEKLVQYYESFGLKLTGELHENFQGPKMQGSLRRMLHICSNRTTSRKHSIYVKQSKLEPEQKPRSSTTSPQTRHASKRSNRKLGHNKKHVRLSRSTRGKQVRK